jgi:archaellum component FlaF (FlaF/FlaG flagellin family)
MKNSKWSVSLMEANFILYVVGTNSQYIMNITQANSQNYEKRLSASSRIVFRDGTSQHSNEQSCSIKAAKFFSNSEVFSLSKMNLFHEVTRINGNNCSVNDTPTAARVLEIT